jgi:preprotein translocase subunit SecG
MVSVFLWIFYALFLFISVIMILLVLVQKGRGGGLSSAFGGGGGNTAFGAKTGDVLTWATSVVFALFIIVAIVLSLLVNKLPGNQSVLPGQAQQLPASPGGPTAPGH